MIKGLAITPPIIGRIAIGHVVEKNGKRLPEKDDFFTITTQIQNWEGWILHPLQAKLAESTPNGKLRAIPVKLLFNAPDLNLRAQYTLFDRTSGRPVCVGDGEIARRTTPEGIQKLPCPSPASCEFGGSSGCKLFGRLNVQIDGQDDEMGTFIFRTTGYNSVRTLAARLHYFEAVSGGFCRHLPLTLRLRGKSTTLSHRTPVYYADLTLREGLILTEAVAAARAEAEKDAAIGVDALRLEDTARQAMANGAFEDSEEEAPDILEEFYPAEQESKPITPITANPTAIRSSPISRRLTSQTAAS